MRILYIKIIRGEACVLTQMCGYRIKLPFSNSFLSGLMTYPAMPVFVPCGHSGVSGAIVRHMHGSLSVFVVQAQQGKS
jgi:hypothetical protein